MIESVMIFALGLLAASLCALLVLPALHARAERLARRRVEAQFPMSIAELTAEKDHLRAEFAVVQRRLERRVDEALSGKQADMEEIGRGALAIEALHQEVEGRDARIAAMEGDLAATRATLEETESRLAERERSLAAATETLGALEDSHRGLIGDLGIAHHTREALATTHGALEETLEAAAVREAALRAEHAQAEGRLAEARDEIDVRRIAISDLETRLLAQSVRADELERALLRQAEAPGADAGHVEAQNAELRRMIGEVADRMLESHGADAARK